MGLRMENVLVISSGATPKRRRGFNAYGIES